MGVIVNFIARDTIFIYKKCIHENRFWIFIQRKAIFHTNIPFCRRLNKKNCVRTLNTLLLEIASVVYFIYVSWKSCSNQKYNDCLRM